MRSGGHARTICAALTLLLVLSGCAGQLSSLPTLPETMLLSTFINSMSRQREQRRYADILFRPETPPMGLLDWHRFEELVAAGRRHGRHLLSSMELSDYR